MYPRLLHIYGPFSIYSYGVAIVLGVSLFLFMTLRHPKRKQLISDDHFYTMISWSILAGLLGGHLLWAITEINSFPLYWHQLIVGKNFGLSIIGTIFGIFVFLVAYLYHHKIPILPFLDLVAIYAPLAQSFGRIGCFFAGCCYGTPTTVPWAVAFTNPESIAPRCIGLHPSQLYSASGLLIIFLLMYFVFQQKFKKPGQLIALYFMLTSTERFATDFFRGDRIITSLSLPGNISLTLSSYQWLALGMFLISLIIFLIFTLNRKGT